MIGRAAGVARGTQVVLPGAAGNGSIGFFVCAGSPGQLVMVDAQASTTISIGWRRRGCM